uniref:MaoC-like domain-containing protein n=1 Tax=Periophthalmus magnuspinnatus TaxID=409849 RepID=A0A3B3Z995_9GOBI
MWLSSKTGLRCGLTTALRSGLSLDLPCSGFYLRSLHVGQVFSLTRTFSEQDLVQFSVLTGDSNPLHLDQDFVKTTVYSRPLVHGVLVNGLISALLGSNAPGCILLKQEIRFPAPLFTNEPVLAQVQVQRVRLSTALVSVRVQTKDQTENLKVVLEGTVTPEKPSS